MGGKGVSLREGDMLVSSKCETLVSIKSANMSVGPRNADFMLSLHL